MTGLTRLAGGFGCSRQRLLGAVGAMALLLTTMALTAPAAHAALGYEPDASTPSISLAGELPHGVAIDQANERIYVTMLSTEISTGAPGQIVQMEGTGVPTAASPFVFGTEGFPMGVAVNPLTQGIYAAQFIASTPIGIKGASKILEFSSAGTLGTQFATSNNPGKGVQIAADSSGNVYFPSDATKAVQVFNSAGALQSTITCGSCTPGGAFSSPASVAVDGAGNVYVVDVGTDRVVKFTHSGANYTFASVLQSGRGAAAVGVDPSDNSVYVGDVSGGGYHVVAYNSGGAQFDDFAGGLIGSPTQGIAAAGQIAVNATTHKLYVSEPNNSKLLVFDRVTINPPTASTAAASSVGQVSAKLNATVNANLHAVTACRFEYIDATGFAANGYTNAIDVNCPTLPNGSTSTPISSTLSGLSPGTTYHYRIVATNNAGTTEGSDTTFTMLPTTPSTVTTQAASGVSQTAATLIGKVNPHGGTVTNCHFDYGVGLSYSTSVPCPTAVGVVTTDVAQSKGVAGLSASTTYHYRLVVTSNAGTVTSNDSEFTTPAPAVVTPETPPTTPSPGGPLPPVSLPGPTGPKPLKCKKGFRKKKVHGKFKCVKVKRHH
jgi:DNA-binding beta-propeller fold protein YncE